VAGSYGPEPRFDPSPLESSIFEALRRKRPTHALRSSAALSIAAHRLASGIAERVREPLAPARIRAALAAGLAFDPSPRTFRVDAPATASPDSLASSIDPDASDTHAGVAVIQLGDRIHVVVLLSSRLAELDPFPRQTSREARLVLRGRLTTLSRPSVHVTSPSGESHALAVARDGGRFQAPIVFDAAGRWTVEVVGEGPRGPQVAALLTVACAGASLELPPEDDPPDPADPRQAEARVVAAIGRTRAQHGLAPLQTSPALSQVARQHAEAMLRAGILAHRLDANDGAADRLRRAQVPFALVLENVAKGPSALAAHRLVEQSPAHRQNVLASEATRVGVGIARGSLAGGEPIVYLTELFTAVAGDPGQDPLTPEARVREAIWRERARLGAPPLTADPRLDELARNAVKEMIRRGDPDPGSLPDRVLSTGHKFAAADAFITGRPAEAARSRNVGDRRFNRVGVSVGIGDDARRFGGGLLWIAVIYAD
jgi:uncharacterized protein YkwD